MNGLQYFCELKNHNFLNKAIKKNNSPEGKMITKQKDIVNEMLQTLSLEGDLTIKELSDSLCKMKNNKSPGSDGFPADFSKVFWSKIKFFVLCSLKECFAGKELSTTMKQTILSCIPKGNMPRHFLKNWRLISLLNVTYKLASATIANRLNFVFYLIDS